MLASHGAGSQRTTADVVVDAFHIPTLRQNHCGDPDHLRDMVPEGFEPIGRDQQCQENGLSLLQQVHLQVVVINSGQRPFSPKRG